MRVQMQKFGNLLNSRPSAREAVLRIRQIVNGSGEKEGIVLDFSGVEILTPSYADELLDSLWQQYGRDNVAIENAETDTVRDTLKAIEEPEGSAA